MQTAKSSRQLEREFRRTGPARPAGYPPATADQRRQFLRDYIQWLKPFRWRLTGVLVLALAAAGLDLLWPLLIKRAIDLLGNSTASWPDRLKQLDVFALGIFALLVVKQFVDSIRHYRLAVLNSQVVMRLRRRLFDRLIHLPLSTITDMKSGGIVARLSGDADYVSGLVQSAIISPGVAAVRVALTLAILLVLSWPLAIAALISLPFVGAVSFLWLRRARPIYRSIRDDYATIDGRVAETFGGLRVVRAFRREKRESRSYTVGHHTIIRKGLRAERIQLALEAAWGLLIPITSVLIVWYGGKLVHAGRATLGDIFAFQVYAALLLQPIWQIVYSVSATQRGLAALERIFGILHTPPDKPDPPDAIDAPDRVQQIRFEHVHFAYRPGVPVIQDFNLTVPAGATVALVGPSGAGKTTVTDLIARFYDPTTGSILLNGVDIRRIRLKSYRSLLAVVQQDTFLFDGTVRENIAYGRRGATDQQIQDAARRANAHEFILRLPERYDTRIGERGVKLSGGEQQRISIARAILADPQILILDEATSNLDTESEQLIRQSLQELFRGRTTFVIAHRLGTITHADIIVVMLNGRIVETGTHQQLLARGGVYYNMVERQQQSFDLLGSAAEARQSVFDS